METETKTDNELIAEFHGWESHLRPHGQYSKSPLWSFPSWGKAAFSSDNFQYHTSWDWLMPVVEKIESTIGTRITIKGVECEINIVDYYDLQIESTKIAAVYKAVLEFIKWYNNQKENGNRNS